MATQDLTTLNAVRRFLQKSATDTAQDALIEDLITHASDAIMRYCQREFKTTTTGSTARSFEYRGGGFLDLSPFDARTITQIRLDTDEATPTTLQTDEWRAYPVHKPHGVYSAVRLDPGIAFSRSRWEYRVCEVTGTWGFAAVPNDVVQATIITVSNWLKLEATAYESVLSTDEQSLDRPAGIPSKAQMLVKPFVRSST
jgi:hypothetical protein